MKTHALSPDERDLFRLAEEEQELDRRRKELEESRMNVEQERSDRECTLPPYEMILHTQKKREHDEAVSRNKVRNIVREQRRSLVLLALLITMTATLVWWGTTLMQGS